MVLVRFLQSVITLALIGIVLVIFQAGASAVGPVIFTADYRAPGATEALNFDRPLSLKLFQADLQSGRPDFYTFQATKGTFLKIKLNTLRQAGQDNFRPSLALFGPGLPPPVDSERRQLPFSLPAGVGLQLSAAAQTDIDSEIKTGHVIAPRVEEVWTQAGYWERQTLLNEAPQDGTYFLVVFSSTDQNGKYSLQVGDKPEAGWRETLTFPVSWLRVHLWTGDLGWPVVGALLILGLVAGLIAYYLNSLSREIQTIGRAGANRRRIYLLHKRLPNKPVGKHLRQRVRLGAVRIKIPVESQPDLVEVPVTNGHITPEPVATNLPWLAGSNWEELKPLPARHINGNGLNGNGNGNGHHLPAPADPKPDGLSQWGQIYRPKVERSSDTKL